MHACEMTPPARHPRRAFALFALLLAVGCVAFTAVAVATVMHFALGMSWTVGLVLGAVVAPPDAVAEGELRFRNPGHAAARLPALAPALALAVAA